MGENQSEGKEVTVKEFEQLRRNSKITLACSIVMLLVVLGIALVPMLWKPTWRRVETFSGGSGTEVTDVFSIGSDHGRIHWLAQPDPLSENTKFYFWVYNKDSIVPIVELSTQTASDFDDAFFNMPAGWEYVTGSGDFDITVWAENALWEITVEEYR